MTTPTRTEIYEEAKRIYFQSEMRNGNRHSINPEYSELLESGFVYAAQSNLMSNKETLYGLTGKTAKSPEQELETAYLKTCYDVFDLPECQRSNLLISGTNNTGKTNLACLVASVLQRLGWRVVAFDSSGAWLEQSDIPVYATVNFDSESETFKIPLFQDSILYDLTLLLPTEQTQFVDLVLLDLRHRQLESDRKRWTMVFLEEAQLYCKNVRGTVSQNILRIMSVGRNQRVRVCCVSPDLALLDNSFIRLTGQRFHARLGIEENGKRKFRAYYGLDWLRVTLEHDLGFYTYLLKDKLQVVKVPLFETANKPVNYLSLKKPNRLVNWLKQLFTTKPRMQPSNSFISSDFMT